MTLLSPRIIRGTTDIGAGKQPGSRDRQLPVVLAPGPHHPRSPAAVSPHAAKAPAQKTKILPAPISGLPVHQLPGQGGGRIQGRGLGGDLAGLPDADDPEEADGVAAVQLQPALGSAGKMSANWASSGLAWTRTITAFLPGGTREEKSGLM